MAFKPVRAHASCVFNIAVFGMNGEIVINTYNYAALLRCHSHFDIQ